MPVDEPVALPQRIYPMRRRLSIVSEADGPRSEGSRASRRGIGGLPLTRFRSRDRSKGAAEAAFSV